MTVDVTETKKGIFQTYAKDASMGRHVIIIEYIYPLSGSVELQLGKLPNGQDFDQWNTLTIPNTRASKGSLRVIATFKHEVILPLEEYRGFSEVYSPHYTWSYPILFLDNSG